jgi:hypothetical protein
MSHAARLARALGRVSNEFNPRIVGAPGATSNWAYGAYLRDRGGGVSRAVVLAFMSMNFPMITTMSPMTWNIDEPMPYTADRFYLEGDRLKVASPPYTSFRQYVETFANPEKWSSALNVFEKYDTMYNPWIMRASFLDHSSLFRLLRRAYGQRFLRNIRQSVLDRTTVRYDSEQVKVAQAIVREFSASARESGLVPIIYIVNNFGYSDNMFEVLKPALESDKIPYLSSHTVISPDDPRAYLPDSHFTDDADNKLAATLIGVLKEAK